MSLEDTQDSSCTDSQETQASDIETKMESLPDASENVKIQDCLDHKPKGDEQNQELYYEILEKLDIAPRQREEDIQEKSLQELLKKEEQLNKIKNLETSRVKNQIEKALSQDFDKIQKLAKAGLINSEQGQNLKKQVLKKAFDKLVQTEKAKRALSDIQNKKTESVPVDKNLIFEEFSKNNPDFFNSQGRQEVLNYLKSGDVILGKDDLNKISVIIRTVEKAAIDRYLQKAAHEKTLRNSNENAKQRLTANAQKSRFNGNISRSFTREQIGKMSGTEFAKYEAAIMEALKKGQIK